MQTRLLLSTLLLATSVNTSVVGASMQNSVGRAEGGGLAAGKPNIIYILADDLGYGDLGVYGQKRFKTPNLDRMASEGMLFTQHYSGTAVCAPSRSSLMTGLTTGHTPIRGNKSWDPEGQWPMPAMTFTVAEMLKEVGYTNGCFGKWGLGFVGTEGDPNTQGFDELGEVLAKVRELGLDNNTLVIFSSDNGPHLEGGADPDYFESNGPLRGYKRDLYEGGIREPMIARWPGKIRAGTKSDLVSAFWDVMPTLAEVSGAKTPAKIDGISFLPTLLAQAGQKQHDYLYWEFHEMKGRQALRKGNWKLVCYNVQDPEKSTTELYDLSKDLGEVNNVAGQHPEVVKELTALMKGARVPNVAFPFGAN